MNSMSLAEGVNILGDFCGRRELVELSRKELYEKYGISQTDVFVLFGGSILAGGDVLAQAIKNNIARSYIIVGGQGHTTGTLREHMRREFPDLLTEDMSEARLFSAYIQRKYNCCVDYLEEKSTNCGNNVTNLLALLREKKLPHRSIIMTQDASMQARMDAGMKKHAPEGTQIINYAAYRAETELTDGKLYYKEEIRGMWEMERYVSLLLGEIVRLRDDAQGYGPCGKDFIAHVDIPDEVEAAFDLVNSAFGGKVRTANPAYAG